MRTVQSVKEITKRGSELSGPFFYIVKRSIWKVRQEMEEEKLRAVYYARCSTEEENQKDALVRQAAEAEEAIRARGWRLVDAYVESRSLSLIHI